MATIQRIAGGILLCMLLVSHDATAITIGAGPSIGTDTAGNSYNEEFQDWTAADLRGVDTIGSAGGRYDLSDGYDDSRDLVAFYTHEDATNYYFRVDLYDLKLGAENGNLDIYVAMDLGSGSNRSTYLPDLLDVQASALASGISAGSGWNLCIALYDNANRKIYQGGTYNDVTSGNWVGSYYNSELDAVEFAITKSVMTANGWDGSSSIKFWVATAKDNTDIGTSGNSDLTDALVDKDRGFSDGYLNGYLTQASTAGRAKYASIAHANQSVNKAADINVHVYDPSVAEKTGFVRALDTHEIFKVPLNMHFSGTLLTALAWAKTSGGASDPSDGPTFLARVKRLIDSGQTAVPLSVVGGVYAEHIMPYFEGDVNLMSMHRFEEVSRSLLGVGASDMKVMHTPERVIRSVPTSMTPLGGFTFFDIQQTTYTATVLDEVTHYHWWFDSANTNWSGNGGSEDKPDEHKIHKVNGVYCFLINDREDQAKFGNFDGGMTLDTRYTLLDKAKSSDQAQITVVFDDWEALAGKSFDPGSGAPQANNNQMQYQRTIRWAANHPWIEIVNLKDVLDRATNNGNAQYNAAWVVDHGFQSGLSMQTYEWLKHACEGTYDNWYYNNVDGGGIGRAPSPQTANGNGNEQNFFNLVPVLTGGQGDYRSRLNGSNIALTTYINTAAQANRSAEADAQDSANGATFIPSGKLLGDMNTPGTIIRDAWDTINTAPSNDLRTLGMFQYASMIYETAWHEEDNGDYHSHNFQNPFTNGDASWDGCNSWLLRLNNHVRDVGYLAYAANWAEDVRAGAQTAATQSAAIDLDQDGQSEYVLRNSKVLAIFQRLGGRCIYAFHYHATAGPVADIGAAVANPSEPGEEERTGTSANRCSAFKDMNGGTYADMDYIPTVVSAKALRFVSQDGLIQKEFTLENGVPRLDAAYTENVTGSLFVRIGASPNVLDLTKTGRTHLSTSSVSGPPAYYSVVNSAGGGVYVTLPSGVSRNASPGSAGYENRNLALTEEVEVFGPAGGGATGFNFSVAFEVAAVPVAMSRWELE